MKDDTKIKHLEFIQAIITRMAGNSFQLKSWGVTLVSALLALAAKDSNRNIIWIAYMPVTFFWFLDAYYLRQERMYRKLYSYTAHREIDASDDLSLDASGYSDAVPGYWCTMFSVTLRAFHGVLFLTIAIITYILYRHA
jgi:hypothetical protein